MSSTFHLTHATELYEVSVLDSTILRIIRFVGSTQMPRETSFEDCPWEVQVKIIERIQNGKE